MKRKKAAHNSDGLPQPAGGTATKINKIKMRHIKYVHGYSDREALRLNDQADTLDDIIHNDTIFLKDSFVLEAGCGVGAHSKYRFSFLYIQNQKS